MKRRKGCEKKEGGMKIRKGGVRRKGCEKKEGGVRRKGE